VTGGASRTPFLLRVRRTALLHADTFEEVEADPSAIGQAAVIVVDACLASGLGFWRRLQMGHSLPEGSLPLTLQLGVIVLEPQVLWITGSAFTYMVGSSFFRGPETETHYAEVLRTTGFAFAPTQLAALAFLPPDAVGLGVLGLARIWTFVACVVAVRQALDFTTLRALGTFGISAALLWLVLWGLSVAPIPI